MSRKFDIAPTPENLTSSLAGRIAHWRANSQISDRVVGDVSAQKQRMHHFSAADDRPELHLWVSTAALCNACTRDGPEAVQR